MPTRTRFAATVVIAILLGQPLPVWAGLEVEPYLQNPQPDGVNVLWWTDKSEPASQVEFGQGDFKTHLPASNVFVPSMGKYVHEVEIRGLPREASYDYRVRSGSTVSGEYSFDTAIHRASDFRVAILGDGHTTNAQGIANHRNVADQARSMHPNLAFETGDMVEDPNAAGWRSFFRQVITNTDGANPGSKLASNVPFQMAVGNHEVDNGANADMARFKAFASNPSNGSTNANSDERYYAVKYGCATFIVLDANNTSSPAYDNNTKLPAGSTPDWEPGSEQYRWMVSQLDLAQRDSAFTFVLLHASPFSRGEHGQPGSAGLRGYELRALDPVFRQYGVDAVVSGHDHAVERSLTGPGGFQKAMDANDPRNLNWLVQGNSGDGAASPEPGWKTWMDITGNDGSPTYSQYYYDWADSGKRSFLNIDIANKGDNTWQATFQTVQDDGDVFDEFSLTRTDAPRTPGDANLDGRVDVGDLGILGPNYGRATGGTWAMADFDDDGAVNASDLQLLAAHYSHSSAVRAPLPEPATLTLLAVGALAINRRRARRHCRFGKPESQACPTGEGR